MPLFAPCVPVPSSLHRSAGLIIFIGLYSHLADLFLFSLLLPLRYASGRLSEMGLDGDGEAPGQFPTFYNQARAQQQQPDFSQARVGI